MGGESVFVIVWGLAVLRELERVSDCTVGRHAAIPPSTQGCDGTFWRYKSGSMTGRWVPKPVMKWIDMGRSGCTPLPACGVSCV